jgi:hypothetical protein
MTDIISFPKDKIVRDPTFPTEELENIRRKGRKQVADAIISEITDALYFIYTMDVLRALVYRNMSIEHPLHEYITNSVRVFQKNDKGEMVDTADPTEALEQIDLSNFKMVSKFADKEFETE